MKRISDAEWEAIFLADRREREEAERKLFEQALERDEIKIYPEASPEPETVDKLFRTLPKSLSPRIDATLDLHLKTRHEASLLIRDFFLQSSRVGDRLVLLITGKGHHSEKKGVLREFVRQWLKNEGKKWILWFAEAPKALGGSGAWLVRLKKQ